MDYITKHHLQQQELEIQNCMKNFGLTRNEAIKKLKLL